MAAPEPPGGAYAGQAFAAHVESQLAEERSTKASLEARGAALITSSGASVTLLAAGFALAFGGDPAAIPSVSQWLVVLSVVALLTASVAGALANKPADYGETDLDDMRTWVKDHWQGDAVRAAQRTADSQLDTLGTARRRNGKKADIVTIGVWAQVVATLLLAGATVGLVGLI